MVKRNIYTKSKTLIINQLKQYADLNFLDDKSVDTDTPDIYFHSGKIDKSIVSIITRSKIVIVNSKSAKAEIVKKIEVNENKIHVIYPAIKKSDINVKEARKEFCEELKIHQKTRIIFFTARTLKNKRCERTL